MRYLILFVMTFAAPAAAQKFDAMQLAANLGTVIGSEATCGLTLKQEAITAFIEKNAPKDDMSFPQTLTMMTQGTEFNNQSLSASAKTAHCAAVTQSARHFGLID